MTGGNDEEQAGKATFDDVYDQPDPRAYVHELSALEYQIPEHARGVFSLLTDATRNRAGGEVTAVDLCCSYGVNTALVNHDLSLPEFFDRYRSEEAAALTTEQLAARDREFYAARRRPDAPYSVGLDAAANAIEYGVSAGILDAGSAEDLEAADPSDGLKAELADTGLVTVTGGIGYISASTFDRVLGAATTKDVPWVAAFSVRWVDMDPIAGILQRYGLVLERLEGYTFRQRRFADGEEADWALARLRSLGIDPDGVETDGYHHTNFFLARTPPEVAATPLEKLLDPVL